MTGHKRQDREPPVIDARAAAVETHAPVDAGKTDGVDPLFIANAAPAAFEAGEVAPAAVVAEPAVPYVARTQKTGLAVAILGGAAVALLGAIALRMGDTGSADIAALRQQVDAGAKESAALAAGIKTAQTQAQALDARLKALETVPPAKPETSSGQIAALDARLAEVEKLAAAAPPAVAAPPPPADAAAAPVAVAALPDLAPLTGRLDTLEPRLAAIDAAQGDGKAALGKVETGLAGVAAQIGALDSRLGPLEATLNAAKTQVRATEARIEAVAATPNSAAVAVVAQSALLSVLAGNPIAVQVAALESLGVDAAKIAPLKAVAGKGAVTPAALAAGFKPLPAQIAASVAPAQDKPQGVLDWIGGKASSLVQVRSVGENAGDAPADLAAAIEATLARGDAAAALAAWDRLPAPAKAVSADWAKPLQQREAAAAAARALLDDAIKSLGARKS